MKKGSDTFELHSKTKHKASLVKKIHIIFWCALACFTIVWFAYRSIPWIAMFVHTEILDNSPIEVPQITEAQFPIKITCEINGEIAIIEEELICEYDGTESQGTRGKVNKWTERFKSGNERFTLLKGEENGIPFEICTQYYGDPQYYMEKSPWPSDEDYYAFLLEKAFNEFICIRSIDGKEDISILESSEVFKKYKLKVLNVELPKPIRITD